MDFLALAVVVGVLLCLDGYGRLVLRWADPAGSPGPGLAGATGLCVFLIYCGPLEALRWASRTNFIVFLAVGLLLWLLTGGMADWRSRLVRLWRDGRRASPGGLLADLALFALVLLLLINQLGVAFNPHDDIQAYLVFPKRILQEGWLGDDPFNVRRVESGTGAGSYLLALFSPFVEPRAMHLPDRGLGSVLVLLLVIEHSQRLGRNPWQRRGALLAATAVTLFVYVTNVSPSIIGVALTYALFMNYGAEEAAPMAKRAVVAALGLAAVASLKGIMLPAGLSVVGAYGLMRLVRGRPILALAEGLLTLGLATLLLAPWMLSQWLHSGVAYYPLLGSGHVTDGSLEHGFPLMMILKWNIGLMLPFLLITAVQAFVIWRARPREDCSVFFCAFVCLAVVASVTLGLILPGGAFRYAYPIFVPALIAGLTLAPPSYSNRPERVGAVLLTILTIPAMLALWHERVSVDLSGFGGNWTSPPAERARAAAIARAQAVVPLGETVLTRLDYPGVLNFQRNRIYNMDWPGSASPDGQILAAGNGPAFSAYLRGHGVRFVIYAYGNEANHSWARFGSAVQDPSPWVRRAVISTFATQAQLLSLKASERVVFDDGADFVVELEH